MASSSAGSRRWGLRDHLLGTGGGAVGDDTRRSDRRVRTSRSAWRAISPAPRISTGAALTLEVLVESSFDQGHQGHRSPGELGLGADPLGEVEGLVKGLIEDAAEQTGCCGRSRGPPWPGR